MNNNFTRLITFFFLLMTSNVALSDGLSFGFIPLDRNTYNNIPIAPVPLGSSGTRKVVDLSHKFPTPGDQTHLQGSCVGWALGYALKSFHENDDRNWGINNQNHQFSPSFVYNKTRRVTNDCLGGTFIDRALNYLKFVGILPISEFPYNAHNCSQLPNSTQLKKAKRYRIAAWRTVALNTRAFKAHLEINQPIIIGAYVDEPFTTLNKKMYTTLTKKEYGHAMVVVGYDDNIKAFKIMNSYGTQWGENGFAWIPYRTFFQMVTEAYVTINTKSKKPPVPNIVSQTSSPQPRLIKPYVSVEPASDPNNVRYVFRISAPEFELKKIKNVHYNLNHPTFSYISPLKSNTWGDDFSTHYDGWGCLETVRVDVHYKNGKSYAIEIAMCDQVYKVI